MNRMPCCLYAGEWDPVFAEIKKASGSIQRAKFFLLPCVSHLQSFVRPILCCRVSLNFWVNPTGDAVTSDLVEGGIDNAVGEDGLMSTAGIG
jgi:hypothetical protein